MAAEPVLARLEAVTAKLEGLAGKLSAGGRAGPPPIGSLNLDDDDVKDSPSVQDWGDFVNADVAAFCNAAKKLKQDEIASTTDKAFSCIGDLIAAADVSKKPSNDELQAFIKPCADAIGAAQNALNKQSPNFNHQNVCAELLTSLSWTMMPTPMGFITGQYETADFFMNKILFACKDSTDKEDQRAFVKSAKDVFNNMKAYVREHHRAGLSYKGKGSLANAGKGKKAGGPPVPPAGGVPPPAAAASAPPAGGGGAAPAGGMAAVFAEINKGGDNITKGFKKVTSDMKTKNRPKGERSGLVSAPAKKKTASKWAEKKTAEVVKPPSISLQRGQHFIEYQVEGQCRVPEGASVKQNVYVYKCGQAIVNVPEKVKAVCIDGCKKTRVVINSVISSVEVVNCQSVIVMITGLVNAFSIDKTAGCQLWLNKETVDANPDIITSNISEMNIQVPGADEEADPVEIPVPEQYLTKIQGKATDTKLETGPVTHG